MDTIPPNQQVIASRGFIILFCPVNHAMICSKIYSILYTMYNHTGSTEKISLQPPIDGGQMGWGDWCFMLRAEQGKRTGERSFTKIQGVALFKTYVPRVDALPPRRFPVGFPPKENATDKKAENNFLISKHEGKKYSHINHPKSCLALSEAKMSRPCCHCLLILFLLKGIIYHQWNQY